MTTLRMSNHQSAGPSLPVLEEVHFYHDRDRQRVLSYLLQNPDAAEALDWFVENAAAAFFPKGVRLAWTGDIRDPNDMNDIPEPITIRAMVSSKPWFDRADAAELNKQRFKFHGEWSKRFPRVYEHFLPAY